MRLVHRVTTFTVAATLAASVAPAYASTDKLPLGDSDLPETRTTQTLAPGVTLTHIVRGDQPADPSEYNTTTRGPWVVNVLTVDPATAKGSLRSTFGPDVARTEPVTSLVSGAHALAGVNASFFTFTANPTFPGDPVGFAAHSGTLESEPSKEAGEDDMIVDSRSNRMLLGKLSWSGSLTNRQTDASIDLEFVNHPPVVPADCADMTDQTQCTATGDVSRFTPEWGSSTPSGKGVEVVLDSRGCVVRKSSERGTSLQAGQTSVQATGASSKKLLDAADGGCLQPNIVVRDADGDQVPMRPGVYGVNGRYPLTSGGKIVVPSGSGSFFDRNPRTIAGRTSGGKIVLVTIDGRQPASVGTKMSETAAVADALHMSDSINLDGGGSTAMSVRGDLVNKPSGGTERNVGDALVWVP